MSLVLHEDLHLVRGSEGSTGATPQTKDGVDMRPNIDVSLTNEVPPTTAFWNYERVHTTSSMLVCIISRLLRHSHLQAGTGK